MRFVIVGLGAIGGTLAARLTQAGRPVVAVARGEQLSVVRGRGLELRTPTECRQVHVDVRGRIADVEPEPDDVVILTVKSQDTADVVAEIAASGHRGHPVLCAQNGVANERHALRLLRNVYGVVVMSPTAFLEPGIVLAYSEPVTGLLDLGRYPSGEDDLSREVAAALRAATYDSQSIADVTRWKYAKLITNLGNAVEALCGPEGRRSTLPEHLRDEARRVLETSGIDYASAQEDDERRGDLLMPQAIDTRPRPGSSVWQSLARGTGATEVDFLNGEIVMLGRLHGVPTPANELVQELVAERARAGSGPGSLPIDEVLARLPD